MATAKKGVTPDQLNQLWEELNLSVSTVATATGLPKSYVSEFRSGRRNLATAQQATLRDFLEQQCAENDVDFPNDDAEDDGDSTVQELSTIIRRAKLTGIIPSLDLPPAVVKQLQTFIDKNRVQVSELLNGPFARGGFLGGDFSSETDEAIRELFGLLAMNYVATLILQGRSIVNQVAAGTEPKTVGEWLSLYLADKTRMGDLLPQAEAEADSTVDDEEASEGATK